MSRRIAIVFALVVVMLSHAAQAQELDRKQAGVLSRLASQVTAAQVQLDKYGPGKLGLNERLRDDFARKLAKFEEMLAPLPADHADVKKEAEHLAAFKAAFATASAALAGDQQAKQEELANMNALLAGPAAEAELEALGQLVSQFKDARHFALDFYIFARWPTHSGIAELRERAEAWPATQKRWAELVAKYEPAAAYKGHLQGAAAMNNAKVVIGLREGKQHYDEFRAAIETFAKDAPAQVEKEGAALKAASDKAVAARDYNAFIQPEGPIEAMRYRMTNYASVWQPLAGSPEAGTQLVERAKTLEAESNAAMEKLASEIIKANKGPKDQYTGADRARVEAHVRAAWAKDFPKESILAVRFGAAAFERRVAWRYDAGSRSFLKSDSSSLPVWVVVKDGPKQAIMWFATVYKQHMKGDELGLSTPPRSSRGPTPDHRLFVSNL